MALATRIEAAATEANQKTAYTNRRIRYMSIEEKQKNCTHQKQCVHFVSAILKMHFRHHRKTNGNNNFAISASADCCPFQRGFALVDCLLSVVMLSFFPCAFAMFICLLLLLLLAIIASWISHIVFWACPLIYGLRQFAMNKSAHNCCSGSSSSSSSSGMPNHPPPKTRTVYVGCKLSGYLIFRQPGSRKRHI